MNKPLEITFTKDQLERSAWDHMVCLYGHPTGRPQIEVDAFMQHYGLLVSFIRSEFAVAGRHQVKPVCHLCLGTGNALSAVDEFGHQSVIGPCRVCLGSGRQ